MPTLTPAQRALIQFIESILITAVIAGLFAASLALGQDGPVDWKEVGAVAAFAFIFSVAHSVAAYFKQHPPVQIVSSDPNDAPPLNLGEAMDQVVGQLEKRYPGLRALSAVPPRASAGMIPPGTSFKEPTVQPSWLQQQGQQGPGSNTGG